MKTLKIGLLSLLAMTPVAVFAQGAGTTGGTATGESVLKAIQGLIDLATPIVIALALLFFFWGLATFILSAGDEEGRKKGKSIMIWGIIALFIIVSIWGLIRVVQQTFKLNTDSSIELPEVKFDGN